MIPLWSGAKFFMVKNTIKRLLTMIILCAALAFGACGILVGCGSVADYDSDAINRSIDSQVDYVPTRAPEDIAGSYLAVLTAQHGEWIWDYFGPYTKDVLLYYGQYGNNAHVIYPSGLFPVFYWKTKNAVADCEFRYPDSGQLNVFCDNNIYGLEEAYNKGILSYNDIHVLRSKYSEKIMLEIRNEVTTAAHNAYRGV